MSIKHLTKGSVEPPRIKGILRLFSMQFCPYAHCARLVLKAKKLPHDIVNINLSDKPEWYSNINSEGKVPALLDGDKVIVESLDICSYLEENYPQNPLSPSDPALKAKDKEAIRKVGGASGGFAKCLFSGQVKTLEEWTKELLEAIQPLEDELAERGTKFFGGDKPNMIDYLLWPWAERSGSIAIKFAAPLPLEDNQIPLLRKWKQNMRQDPVAAELYIGPEVFWKLAEFKLKNEPLDYDTLLK